MYVDLVILLNFAVDLLLILGTNRLAGYPPGFKRAVLAALLGGIYAGGCLLPEFDFLGNGLWCVVTLCLMSAIAFGLNRSVLRRTMIFVLLSFALNGAAMAVGNGGFGSLLLAAAAVAALCAWGLQGKIYHRELIPVELCYGDKTWNLTALRDTGNMLRDPLTGEQVLVVGADMGQKLLGLSPQQLAAPTETLAAGQAPGMRLIPYHTVGQQGAMLLALRLRDVKVGSWRGNALVAFAPECFGKNDGYQMLVGGVL